MKIREIIPFQYLDENRMVPTSVQQSNRTKQLAAWLSNQELKRPVSSEEIAKALLYLGNKQRTLDKNYIRDLQQKLANALKY